MGSTGFMMKTGSVAKGEVKTNFVLSANRN